MRLGAIVAAGLILPATAQQAPPDPQQLRALEEGLHRQTGDIAVPAAHATLHLGQDYYFLGADEAKRVLTEAWGNPPNEVESVLGLVMPKGRSVLDGDTWGAVVTWQDTGHVNDDDATTANYDEVLTQLRSGEDENNRQRQQAGFPAVHLVGWAQPPSYDPAHHSIVWARDLRFDRAPADGLNYDVRVLGRQGVLSLNMLWDMPHLAEARTAAASFGQVASFDAGSRYEDYRSGVDHDAGYGLAGLVAAGVGVAVAKKLGFLALALGFGKKIILFVIAGGAAAWRWMRGRFRRDSDTI